MSPSPPATTPTPSSPATFQSSPDGAALLMMPPDSWAAVFNLTIMDPDGWRRDGKPFDEPIDEAEFLQRVSSSTIRAYGYPGTAL